MENFIMEQGEIMVSAIVSITAIVAGIVLVIMMAGIDAKVLGELIGG